jgi:hypothetical protein
MRADYFHFTWCLSVLIISAVGLCQTAPAGAPIPDDPMELATGTVQVATTPQQRASVLGLLEQARENRDLWAAGTSPYAIHISFDSIGGTVSSGPGEMTETWMNPFLFRWSAQMTGYSIDRLFYQGLLYDNKTPGPMPIRLQMARVALEWPLPSGGAGWRTLVRYAAATWNGSPATCVLLSWGGNPPTATAGRRWQESEYCIDAKSGLLDTYSPVPGFYAAYNYSSALSFHGHVLPNEISEYEGGVKVLRIHVDSITDAGPGDPAMFTPSPGMSSPGAIMRGPLRLVAFVPAGSAATGGALQRVIVHATLENDGKVLEAEVVESPDPNLSQAALSYVERTKFPIWAGARLPFQREVFINVHFLPAPSSASAQTSPN